MKHRLVALITCVALGASLAAPAFAWGFKGHHIVSRLGAENFSSDLPAFARSAAAVNEIAFLGPELDDLKGSGRSWDADYDPAHYIDVRDDGTIAGDVRLGDLPPTREAYDTALRAGGSNQYEAGYLPYSILDGWEQLRDDFGYWRVDNYRAVHAATEAERAAAAMDRGFEQALVLRDIGVWSHYVGDASQPLHVTVHYNGWGDFPNPKGYTQSRDTHSSFESDFVNRYAQAGAVAKLVVARELPDPSLVTQEQALAEIVRYLKATNATVDTLYRIEKAGGFANGSPEAVRFVDSRLAAGASELRDLVDWAWRDSLHIEIGYPEKPVEELLQGAAPSP